MHLAHIVHWYIYRRLNNLVPSWIRAWYIIADHGPSTSITCKRIYTIVCLCLSEMCIFVYLISANGRAWIVPFSRDVPFSTPTDLLVPPCRIVNEHSPKLMLRDRSSIITPEILQKIMTPAKPCIFIVQPLIAWLMLGDKVNHNLLVLLNWRINNGEIFWLCFAMRHDYRPRSEGDNVLGSIRPSVSQHSHGWISGA